MLHEMRLDPEPFKMIKHGKKTIELRLFDEKRRKIKVGDSICFTNTSDENRKIYVVVKALHLFDDFEKLYQKLPLMKCGYDESNINDAKASDMNIYYLEEKQKKHGVVGIEVMLL